MKINKNKLTWVGSEWGGLYIDLNLVEEGKVVVSAGIANDTTFDESLILTKNSKIYGIDPTTISREHVSKKRSEGSLPHDNFILLNKALFNKSGETISLGGPAKTYLSEGGESAITITLDDIIKENNINSIEILKIDIEAAEYPVLLNLETLPPTKQICLAFHHWLNGPTDQYPNPNFTLTYTLKDTVEIIKKLKRMGFKLVNIENDDPGRYFQETLFIHSDYGTDYKDIKFEYNGERV